VLHDGFIKHLPQGNFSQRRLVHDSPFG
jgi:hypothetical protein